jgi:uncharacterized protein (TIGR01777 family)
MSERKVLVSGGTGFIGAPLVEALRKRGDEVVVLTRGATGDGRVHWDPAAGELDAAAIEGVDAVIHLAGESIAGLWVGGKKKRILDSRKQGTSLLARTVAELDNKPSAFISASAIGFYGSRGDEVLTEDSGNGEGFLADLVDVWEASAQPAREAGIRTVNLRVGLVLAEDGGVIGAVKPLFKLGAGGKLASGQQWWSWVTLHDVVRAYLFVLDNDELSGPYNLAAPSPVTNAEFTKDLGKALHRPTILPAPKFALKLALREMADEMLLASQRVDSSKLEDAGFAFDDVELKPTLNELFG